MKHPKYRLLIIGLDGAGLTALQPQLQAGTLPTLARLARNGLCGKLLSTQPPLTLPAWTSFLTGAPPAVHGVTDLLARIPGSYRLQPTHGGMRTLPTFLARIARKGMKVASLGVPGTYPPERSPAWCVAGFDAPGVHKAGPAAVWPPALWPELEQLGGWRYATFNEQRGGPRRLQAALKALIADLEAKERAILSLYERQRWDLFFVHLQASDTVGHHFWHTFDPRSPRWTAGALSEAIPRVYARLDVLLGRLIERTSEDTRTLVLSDHGMAGASDGAIFLNRLLHQMGLLEFAGGLARLPSTLGSTLARAALGRLPPWAMGQAIRLAPRAWSNEALALLRHSGLRLPDSRAFSCEIDCSPSVWIHRRESFPQGCVDPPEISGLRCRIKEALLQLRDPAGRGALIEAVYERQELAPEGRGEQIPDLVIQPAWPGGYRPSFLQSGGPGPAVSRLPPAAYAAGRDAGLPGVHHPEGILFMNGPGIPTDALPPLAIPEATALVFALMGLSIPGDLCARPPASLEQRLDARMGPDASQPTISTQVYSPQESLAVAKRLQSLGYLD